MEGRCVTVKKAWLRDFVLDLRESSMARPSFRLLAQADADTNDEDVEVLEVALKKLLWSLR